MVKKTKVLLTTAIAIVISVVAAGWLILHHGFSARDEPTAIEAFVARRVRTLAIPQRATQLPNPVPATPEVLAEAMAHFADHCATCHANDGSGDTSIGKGLYPKPPDFRKPATQNLTDGQLFYIIHNGIRLTGMPAFGEETTGEADIDSWKLVHFIRHLRQITPEELERMKEMNPKGPDEWRAEEEARKFLEGEPEKRDENQPKGHKH